MGRGERYGCSMHREESKNRVKEPNLPYIYNKHDTFRTSGRTHCSASRTILLIFEQIAVRSSGVVQKRRYDTLGVCKTKAFLISCPKKSEVWRKSRYRLATRRRWKGGENEDLTSIVRHYFQPSIFFQRNLGSQLVSAFFDEFGEEEQVVK